MIFAPVTSSKVLPRNWRDFIADTGALGIGVDIATTAKAKSNPSAVALVQRDRSGFAARVVVKFKTADPAVTTAVIRELCDLPHGLRVRKVCADATSERFYVGALRRELAGLVTVEGVVGSEGMEWRGEKMMMKAFLGNLLVNTIEDGNLSLPRAEWLRDNLRQVKRASGSFETTIDEDGNHGDAFDALKLALFALVGKADGGPAAAAPVQVGTFGRQPAGRPAGRNILARFFGHKTQRMS